jgi:DNA repair protein RecN (Recombination protein N)
LGVIDNATVLFKPGLNVLTGETGAGKTMVLTALSLVLGGKSDTDLIRRGGERLSVSGRFSLPNKKSPRLLELLESHDPELEEGSLLMSRSVQRDGKSRAQLGGVAATVGTLSAFGSELIEIHGQHGALTLGKESRQRELLDSFGGIEISNLLEKYRNALSNLRTAIERVAELRTALRDRDREIETLRELVNEFARVKPKVGELAELSSVISRLESVEDLRAAASGARESLESEDGGASVAVGAARRFLASGKKADPALHQLAERIDDIQIELNEVSRELGSYLSGLEADPRSLEELLNRRAILMAFGKRFGDGNEKVELYESAVSRGEGARARIADLSGGEERLSELESEVQERFDSLLDLAGQLSQARKHFASQLGKQVIEELRHLAMPHAQFVIEVNYSEPKIEESLSQFGCDEVVMKFSAHKEGEFLPIGKSASGGELSRLMLAIEVAIAGTRSLGTYLFDEVDSGIGGKTALEVGKRLKELSKTAQVIVVTHLPQVAIWADNHLRVMKDSSGSITESSIEVISGEVRELEIARMLSGLADSEHAQEHARELLDLGKARAN